MDYFYPYFGRFAVIKSIQKVCSNLLKTEFSSVASNILKKILFEFSLKLFYFLIPG